MEFVPETLAHTPAIRLGCVAECPEMSMFLLPGGQKWSLGPVWAVITEKTKGKALAGAWAQADLMEGRPGASPCIAGHVIGAQQLLVWVPLACQVVNLGLSHSCSPGLGHLPEVAGVLCVGCA